MEMQSVATEQIVVQDVSPEFTIALDNLIFDMQQANYTCGAPSQEVAELDAEIVSQWDCRQCKGKLHYEPFVKGKSYRPFMVCVVCGQVREF